MGYIREPKNVDLVVGPSEFTEETKHSIAQAIRQYRSTGKKPVNVEIVLQGSSNLVTHPERTKTTNREKVTAIRRQAKT